MATEGRRGRAAPPLCTVEVEVEGVLHVGYLYAEDDRFVVLLRGLVEGMDLGPLRIRRDDHIEPETDVVIFPRASVVAIRQYERPR